MRGSKLLLRMMRYACIHNYIVFLRINDDGKYQSYKQQSIFHASIIHSQCSLVQCHETSVVSGHCVTNISTCFCLRQIIQRRISP